MSPIVPIIGAAAGLAGILQGVSQNSRAKRMYRDAMNAHKAIPLNDPAQLSYLDDVRMHRRALEAGTSKMMGLRTRIAQNGLAQTQANAARNAGGSAGTLMDILLRSQQQFGNTLNEGAAQEQQQALGLLGQEGQLISDMSDRRYAHQKWMRDLKLGEYAQMRQDASANISGGIATLASAGVDAASMIGTEPRMGGVGQGSGLSFLDDTTPPVGSVLKSGYQLGDLARPRKAYNYGFGYAPQAQSGYGL